MNQNDYKEQKSFSIFPVTFTNKAKSCGKNCAKCPHPGYWYAVIASYYTHNRASSEVYLGKKWGTKELLERVAPKIETAQQKRFADAIQRIDDEEQLATFISEREQLAAELTELKKSHILDLETLKDDYKDALSLNAETDRALKTKINALKKKLAAGDKAR